MIFKEILSKKKVLVMGILNVTPDSFSDGGLYVDIKKAVSRAKQMILEGADIIDIGGESTRPGAKLVGVVEELKRVVPVILAIRRKLGKEVYISVDTYKSAVAEAALKSGANMVNSIGGISFEPGLGQVVAKYKCPFMIYHIKGKPRTMQKGQINYKDIIADITNFFNNQIDEGKRYGIGRDQFILDPGIGFGKTVEQNLEIIRRLRELKSLKLPIAVGLSRKSHLGQILQKDLHLNDIPEPTDRLEACLAETAVAVQNGAQIIRTHDILETKKFVAVLSRFIK